jgi:hypothetical protein
MMILAESDDGHHESVPCAAGADFVPNFSVHREKEIRR